MRTMRETKNWYPLQFFEFFPISLFREREHIINNYGINEVENMRHQLSMVEYFQ